MERDNPPPGDEHEPSRIVWTRVFIENLISVLLAGLAINFWIYHYTDWFPVIGAIASLGGVLSWVAFVLKKLPGEGKPFFAWFYCRALEDPLTRSLAVKVIALTLICGNFVGSVQLESLPDSTPRLFQMHRARVPLELDSDNYLFPGSRVRRVFLTFWFWSPGVQVKIDGLPEQVFDLHPWQRVELRVPHSLYRPIVLLRPSHDLITVVRQNPLRLEVTIGTASEPLSIPAFDGHTVWIGCEADVDVPAGKLEQWKRDGEPVAAIPFWSKPQSGIPVTLKPGDEIRAALVGLDGKRYTETHFSVLRLQRVQDFPQVEDLDVPRS